MAKKRYKKLTLGHLRELTKDLPDSAPVFPDWDELPGKYDPGVEIKDMLIATSTNNKKPYLSIKVALFHLDD